MKKVANILPEQHDASRERREGANAAERCIEETICCVIVETDWLLNSALLENAGDLR